MSDRPNAQDLLLIARDELMRRLLPELPPSVRYEALMVANAMAIAAREFESGRENDVRELNALKSVLLGDAKPAADSDHLLDHALTSCRRKLCMEIRAGNFDAQDRRADLARYLKATAKDKVAISNPRLLAPAK